VGIVKLGVRTRSRSSPSSSSSSAASPSVVAIKGLMVSTFPTRVYVPILYALVEDAEAALGRIAARPSGRPVPA